MIAASGPALHRYWLARDYPGRDPFAAACAVMDADDRVQQLWHDADGASLHELLRGQWPLTLAAGA